MTLSKSLEQLARESLASGTCPHCKEVKQPERSFCYRCFKMLPPNMQKRLYKTFSEGYVTAWDEAVDWLKVNVAH